MDGSKQKVLQKTIILPDCDYKVPVLSVDKSMLYIPLIAFCKMLGLQIFYEMWTICYPTRENGRAIASQPINIATSPFTMMGFFKAHLVDSFYKPNFRYSCSRETETSLHLLPGWFLQYTGKRDHLFYSEGDALGT